MKQTILLAAIALLGFMAAKAQLKIGAPPGAPDASAMLQVESSTKGLRLPQVALTTTTTFAPVTTPTSAPAAVGLTVYNTTAGITSSNPLYPKAGIGTYAWDGTGWAAASTVAAITSQDLRAVGTGISYNHVTKDAGVGFNGTSLGTGDGNLAIGNSAMSAITTGSDNVSLGVVALGTNTTGGNNVAIGPSALGGNTTSSNNVAIGSNALSLNGGATGGNIAIGRFTLSKNDGTSPAPSIAIGDSALANIIKAGNNIAMGKGAMRFATGGATYGAENIAIGAGALAHNTGNATFLLGGNNNIAIGNGSMDANTEGEQGIGIGHGALSKNTTGIENIGVGESVLYSNVTGNQNTAFGSLALYNNTGSSNTAIGTGAGRSITSGNGNTALGYSSLFNGSATITGSNNTAVGYSTLPQLTSGAQNTAVGFQAGFNVGTGNNNTFLGWNAGNAVTTGSQNITIGYQAQVTNPAGTNQMSIGGAIFGAGISTSAPLIGIGSGYTAAGPQAVLAISTAGSSPTGPTAILITSGAASAFTGNLGTGTGSTTTQLGTTTDGIAISHNTVAVQTSTNNANLYLAHAPGTSGTSDYIRYYQSGTAVASVSQNGGAGVLYNNISDVRLKENINPTAFGIADLMKIDVRDYNYKSETSRMQTGFIAQQLYTVFPNAVTPGGDDAKTQPWMVDYSRVTPLLVKAIQDQQAAITAKDAKITMLEIRLEKLEKIVEAR